MRRVVIDILESRQMLSASPETVDWLNGLPNAAPQIYDASLAPAGTFIIPSAVPPPAPVTTIVDHGPVDNRIAIVLVGDGFTVNQLTTYAQNAQSIVNQFFNEAPLSTYAQAFNVYRVDVVSVDSGVDADPTQGITRTTALDMSYFGGGIERLLTVNTSKAKSYAANAPRVDQVIAIANSTKYGGGGYSSENVLTVAGGNVSAVEIAKHEFGHSFADLADEYDYGGPTTWTGGEINTANVSIYNASQISSMKTKWWRWIGTGGVSAYEGANYSEQGIYRPTNNSKMRSLGRPFEAVNTEQLVLEIYRHIKPIDSATAPGTYRLGDDFFVDPFDPSDHSLSVQWYLDGSPIAGQTGVTFDSEILSLTGTHTLSVKVVDNTTMVRDEAARTSLMTQQLSWTLNATLGGGVIAGNVYNDPNSNGVKDGAEAGIASWTLYLDANNNNIKDGGEVTVTTDSSGNYAFTGLSAGTHRVKQVLQGGYRKTSPGTGIPGYDVVLSGSDSAIGKNFGVTTNILLGGTVFNDANSNGVQDGGEAGVAGVTVNIVSNATIVATRVTDVDGKWRVQGLSAGAGSAELVNAGGLSFTSPSVGKYFGSMSSGQQNANLNFGVHAGAPSPAPAPFATIGTVMPLLDRAGNLQNIDEWIDEILV